MSAEYAPQGCLAVSALRTAALYQAAVRIAPPPLCHPWSEGRMLGVEVSGHGLGVAVYHYRARALHDSGGCGMDAAVVELDALAYCYATRTSTATDPTSLPRHSARGIGAHPEACAHCRQLYRANPEWFALEERCASPLRHRRGCWGQWRSHGSAALQAPHGSTVTFLVAPR